MLKELINPLSKAYNHSIEILKTYKGNTFQKDKLSNLEKEITDLRNEISVLRDEFSEIEFFKFYTDQLKASVYILENQVKELKAKPKSSFETLNEDNKESFSFMSDKKWVLQ